MRSLLSAAAAAALSLSACTDRSASTTTAAPETPTASAEPAASAPAIAVPMPEDAAADAPVLATEAALPQHISEGAESRTVSCQALAALQAEASAGTPDEARYQAAADAWGLRLREEQGGPEAASQYFASTYAVLDDTPAPVLRAGADQCVAAAPRG